MTDDLYLKKSKTRGITYYKVFRKVQGGKDEYVMMLGTLPALCDKLVLLKKLQDQDQQIKPILDHLSRTRRKADKDQGKHFNLEGGVLEGEK